MKLSKLIIFLLLICLGVLIGLVNPWTKTEKSKVQMPQPTVVVGEGNPGRISLYRLQKGKYLKQSFDTGFKFVWTVRIGDVKNLGYNQIYAGVGNGFFKLPIRCQVVVFDPKKNFESEVIDDLSDIRCKDLTIGDLENNGKKQLILATHGLGLIKAYSFENNTWQKRELDKNYLEKFDKETGSDHKVPLDDLAPGVINQSAVHIVKVGDADNDGKNDLLAVVSDPLENPSKDHKLFVRLFKVTKDQVKSEIIDTLEEEIPFKATVDVLDLDNDGKNEVIVGASHHKLFLYQFTQGKWVRQVIDQEEGGVEDNMKGLAIKQVNPGGSQTIFLATGVPQAAVYRYDLKSSKFEKKELFNISQALDENKIFKGIGDNSLDLKVYDLNKDGKDEIIVVGLQDTSALADKFGVTKFGFEATTLGFELVLEPKDNTLSEFTPRFLDFRSALSLDVGELNF